MKKLAIHWVVSAATLMLLPMIFQSGINIDEWSTAFFAAVIIGVVNISIRPILNLVTLPIRWLTLGLFTLVINGFCLYLVAEVVPGFEIPDFFPTAILAAFVYSAITYVAGSVLIGDD